MAQKWPIRPYMVIILCCAGSFFSGQPLTLLKGVAMLNNLKDCPSSTFLRTFASLKKNMACSFRSMIEKKIKIRQVMDALERFAPLPLQESYDNAGLQVGLTEAEISGALLCLDVTEAVVDEAVGKGCNLIVAHHPLIFRKLSCVSDGNYVERAVMKAIKNDVAIVAAHTNLDNAEGGVNFKMAEKIGLQGLSPLQGPVVDGKWSGVVGNLPQPMAAEAFVELLKRQFGVASLRANELLRRPVRRVALCGGAGSFMLGDAIRAGADAFVTGEMGYHEFFGHGQQIQICVIGHYESEQFTTEIFRDIILRECPGVPVFIAETNTNPILFF